MVVFENVTKAFGNSTVISELSLKIERGQFAVLIGPSGCGKTTTLKMINRLVEPTAGNIFVDEKDVTELDPVDLRRQIGYVIQQIGLFPNMTIEQNVEVVPRLLKWPKEKRRERTRELLQMVGMEPSEYLNRYPSELSGGQQQRIGVLRALAASPPLLLMDEPFGALDPITRELLQDEIKRLQKKLGITVVFVTHEIDEAVRLADTIILMKDGRIVQQDFPERLLSHPANDYVREFVGKKRIRSNYDVDLVSEIMNPRIITVTKDRGFSESINLMRSHNVDTLIVVDDESCLLGVIPVETLLSHAGQNQINYIGELPLQECPSINLRTQAREAFDILISENVPFLVVVDGRNRVRGLVTKTSLVKALANTVWGDDDD